MGRLRRELQADYARNRGIVQRTSVFVVRLNQAAHRGRFQWLKKPIPKVLDLIWIQLLMGSEIPARVPIGPGIRLPHAGRRVIIHPNVTIGRDVTIYHGTTLGVIGSDTTNVPSIADSAYIGANATIVGRVRVGSGARVGAGAVVTKDVPAGATAIGNPAAIRDLRGGGDEVSDHVSDRADVEQVRDRERHVSGDLATLR